MQRSGPPKSVACQDKRGPLNLLPSLLALCSAALFGLNVHVQRRGLHSADPWVGAFYSVAAMAVFFWVFAPLAIRADWLGEPATAFFAVAGLLHPAVGQSMQILSISFVGPALTSAFGAFTPFFAVIPAVLLLGEEMNLQLGIGMALMTLGLVLAAMRGRGIVRSWPLWAIALPLTAAAARGIVQPIYGAGLAQIPSPYLATLVAATVSAAVLTVVLIATGRAGRALRPGRGGIWFAISGLINGVGILALNAAIGLGGVTLAGPLVAAAPLFAVFFGAVLFRTERIGPRVLLVSCLVVAGAVLIVAR